MFSIFERADLICIPILSDELAPGMFLYHEHRFLEIEKVVWLTPDTIAVYFAPWDIPHNELRYYMETFERGISVYVDIR